MASIEDGIADLEQDNERLRSELAKQKGTVEGMRESEERFRLIFLGAAEGILVADIKYKKFRLANPAICSMLGYTAEELGQLSVPDIHPPQHREHMLGEFMALASRQKTVASNIPCVRKDGTVFYADITGTQITLDGTPLCVGFFTDVTKRRQAEEALKQEHAFNHAIIQSAANGICVCQEVPDYPYVAFSVWNQRMTEITGYTMEEINRLGWYQSLCPDPELQAKARARMDRMRQGEDLHGEEWQATRKDGTKRVLSVSTSIVRNGPDEVHVLGLIQDVTERKRTEEALKQSVSLLRATLDATADGILVVDRSGGITGYNDRFRQMWRIPDNVLASRSDQQALDFVLAQLKYPEQFIAKVRQLYTDTEAESFDTLEFNDDPFVKTRPLE